MENRFVTSSFVADSGRAWRTPTRDLARGLEISWHKSGAAVRNGDMNSFSNKLETRNLSSFLERQRICHDVICSRCCLRMRLILNASRADSRLLRKPFGSNCPRFWRPSEMPLDSAWVIRSLISVVVGSTCDLCFAVLEIYEPTRIDLG